MIIDAHCHAGKGDRMTDPWNTDAPLGQYLRRAQAAGIHRTVVFPPFHSDYEKANGQLAKLVEAHQPRLLGFASVHATRDAGRIHQIIHQAHHGFGFRGIKVHGHDASPTRELCEAARRFRLPVIVDVFGRPHIIEMVAPQYPDVAWIVAHLGSFSDDWRVQQQVVDQLVRHPNVYADTSGVRRFDFVAEAVRRAGARKLLFGSDGPWLHPQLELEKIRLLRLQRAEEKLVMGGNLLRLVYPD